MIIVVTREDLIERQILLEVAMDFLDGLARLRSPGYIRLIADNQQEKLLILELHQRFAGARGYLNFSNTCGWIRLTVSNAGGVHHSVAV